MKKEQKKTLTAVLTLSFTLLVVIALSFSSCKDNSRDYQSQVDSLNVVITQLDSDYQELSDYLTIISNGLDSISMQENILFYPNKERPLPSREKIQQELSAFRETLKTQREQMEQLEQKMKSGNEASKKLRAIVVSLRAQLVEKESQIAVLQEEMNNKNATIEQLNSRMSALVSQSAMQQEMIVSQHSTIQAQDEQLNEGFIKIATKSELKQAGLLSGSFLKKNRVDYSKVDRSLFRSIDIRVVTEVEINSKNPKILTQVPADTYTLETNGDKTILRILDPTRFWDVSKFLIIQL